MIRPFRWACSRWACSRFYRALVRQSHRLPSSFSLHIEGQAAFFAARAHGTVLRRIWNLKRKQKLLKLQGDVVQRSVEYG